MKMTNIFGVWSIDTLGLCCKSFIVAGAFLAIVGTASGDSIGLKLGINGSGGLQNTAAGALLPEDLAGALGFAQTNWNTLGRWGDNVSGSFNVVDSSGANTGIIINWDATGNWSQQGGGTATPQGSPDGNLMNAYDDSGGNANVALGTTVFGNNGNNKPLVYLSGLTTWLATQGASTYDVVIYADGDATQGRSGEYWLQAASGVPTTELTFGSDLTTHAVISDRANFVGTLSYVEVPLASLCSWGAAVPESGGGNYGWGAVLGNTPGNYVVFRNVSADSFLLRTEEFRGAGGTLRSPVNAIQIVPSTTVAPVSIAPLAGCEVYAGGTAKFRAQVGGLASSFQWQKNGADLADEGNITGSATATLTIANVSAADAANYQLVVSNTVAVVTSSVAPLTMVAPVSGSYPQMIAENNPVAYWRLNELADPSTNNSAAYDHAGSFNGAYGIAALNGANGVVGPQSASFPGFESSNTALQSANGTIRSWVVAPPLALNTNTVTMSAWIYPTIPNIPNGTGILFSRTTNNDVCGLNYGANNTIGYTWNNAAVTFNFASGLTIPSDLWSLVACVVTPSNATLYVYNASGQLSVTNTVEHAAGLFSGFTCIGDDPSSANTPQGRAFTGAIDEVAVFNRSLAPLDIYNLYKKGLGLEAIPPVISSHPKSVALYEGRTAKFSVVASGDAPLSYQWRKNGTPLGDGGRISGASTASLTISDVVATDADSYDVVVSNLAGDPATSDSATLVVVPFTTPDGYEQKLREANPISYWRLNEESGSAVAFDYWGGDISTHTNLDGSITVATGLPGPQPPDFVGFEDTNVSAFYNGFDSGTDTGKSLNNLSQFTILGWFNSGTTQLERAGLFGQNDVAEFGFHGADLGIWTPGGGFASFAGQGQTIINQGQWYMVAGIGDGSKISLYLLSTNGVLQTSTSVTTTNYGSSAFPFRIGGHGILDATGNPFFGNIDEVAIFDRALTINELSDLFGAASTGGALPPTIAAEPSSLTLYAGHDAQFTAGVVGSEPLTYRWRKDGVNISDAEGISGTATPTLNITNVTAADIGDYRLFITNSAGSITSSVARLEVITPDGYEAAVIGLNPLAYYRLNEMSDPSSGTVPANDFWGGHTGIYQVSAQNGFNGIAGPLPPDFSFESNNTALAVMTGVTNSWATAPIGSLSTNTVTFTMWIQPTGTFDTFAGLLVNRGGGVEGGFGYTGGELGYTWNNNSGATYGFRSGLIPPLNEWSFVAVIVEPTQATVYMSAPSGGLLSATNVLAHTSDVFGNNWRIGSDNSGADGSRTFTGIIDEVAVFNYAMTPGQLAGLYSQGLPQLPMITIQQSDQNIILSWPQGTLLEADDVTGPYTTNSASSPYTTSPVGAKKFYRVQVE